MRRTRTFIDASVLITAARGVENLSARAVQVLDDPDRVFVASDFLRLEVLPKALHFGRQAEVEFYEAFFSSVVRFVATSRRLVEEAAAEAAQAGLSAVDALHVAAAKRARCDELVTAEQPTKALFRVTNLSGRVDSHVVRSLPWLAKYRDCWSASPFCSL